MFTPCMCIKTRLFIGRHIWGEYRAVRPARISAIFGEKHQREMTYELLSFSVILRLLNWQKKL